MKNEAVLIALMQSFVDAAVNEYAIENPPIKGPRGAKGQSGRDFDIDLHRESIVADVRNVIKDLEPSLKLKFNDLSDSEILSLRGSKGKDGKDGVDGREGVDGKDFSLEENTDIISNLIYSMVDEASDRHKLTYNDLSDGDKAQLRGPRGQKGKQGSSFIFEDERAEIEDILKANKLVFDDLLPSDVDKLKLKFSHLTDEDKDNLALTFDKLSDVQKAELRGASGSRGAKGLQGEQGPTGQDGQDGAVGSDGPVGDEGLKGPRGLRGEKGQVGEPGEVGVVGDKGEHGSRGQRGQRGEQGPVGEVGSLGPIGADGPKGSRGQKGQRGQDGDNGDKGDRGAIGPMGAMGCIGPTGATGSQGGLGISGPKGEDAPVVIDVKTFQKKDKFYLRFEYSDGSTIETDYITMPKGGDTVVQMLGGNINPSSDGGTGEISIEGEGVAIASTDTLNFTGGAVSVTQDGDKVTVDVSTSVESATFLLVNRKLDEDITENTLVTATSGTNIAGASSSSEAKSRVLGMLIESGVAGESKAVLLFGNRVSTGFTYGLNKPLYLNPTGGMQETIPVSGWVTKVASSNGSGSIFVQPEEPMEIG
ncbi:MAG: collagen-like protein [Bacteriovoracaceae bacterium]|nr:collagen-like protein [Bacteriovoracaceae bacterium]